MDHTGLHDALRQIANGQTLSRESASAAFRLLMRGEVSSTLAAALLFGLRARGERPEEVAGAVDALRAEMRRVESDRVHELVDTCGTGGGGLTTLNISTAAAFVVAGAGIPVAKHGNRSFTSRSGSADVLEALGVDINLEPARASAILAAIGLVFLFAPTYHPAMRHVAPTRRELAVPTIMNLLGPLVNPAGASRQVVGVGDLERGPLVAEALALLGAEHALVLHAEAGMDEVSPAGLTFVWEVQRGTVRSWQIDPRALGLESSNLHELAGGTPAENASRMVAALEGRGNAAERAAILLNAGAAIYVSGKQMTMADATVRARQALESGAAREALERLRRAAPLMAT